MKKDINWIIKEHKKLNRQRVTYFWLTILCGVIALFGVPTAALFIEKEIVFALGWLINMLSIVGTIHSGVENDRLVNRQNNFEKKHGIKEE